MRVYWSETLSRCHLAAATSIRRGLSWLNGAVTAAEEGNAFALAACLRSFIEAAADTNDGLAVVPLTLASMSQPISRAVQGKLNEFVVNEELEEKLIHFAYAARLKAKDQLPKHYRAKQSAEYVAEFNAIRSPRVIELYAHLCEYVHPAAASVQVFLQVQEQPPFTTLSYKPSVDLGLPDDLSVILQDVAMLAFNPPVVTLGMLNLLPLASLHTPELTPQLCSGIPLWANIERAFEGSQGET